jgi:hypothetical protein
MELIMHRKDAIAWVVSVCAASLRLSQAKTLAIVVASALRVERISLANIGRCILGGSVKHQIKRTWRFCANPRIETADAMRGIVKKLLRRRRKPLIVAQNFNKTGEDWAGGNFTYSSIGLVSFADLLIVAQNFNQPLPLGLLQQIQSSTVAVPEPTALVLTMSAAAGLLTRRRRKKDRSR